MAEKKDRLAPEKTPSWAVVLGLTGVAGGLGYVLYRLTRPPALAPAEIVVSDLVISPAEVYPGEVVTISVLVRNIGQVAGTATITLEVE